MRKFDNRVDLPVPGVPKSIMRKWGLNTLDVDSCRGRPSDPDDPGAIFSPLDGYF